MSTPLPGRRRLTALLAVCFFLILLSPTPSFAGHGTAPVGWPDNADQYVDRKYITEKTEIAVARGIAQLNRSDLNVTLNGSGDIDVWDAYYGDTGWDGVTNCQNRVITTWPWERKCDEFRIRYNQDKTDDYSNAQMKTLGCHEFGHTAGLDERYASDNGGAVSCMRATGFASRKLDTHDLEVINARY